MARHRPQKAKSLGRSKASRAPYEKVLIVCEGEKTEPNYFKELRDYFRINSANIVISGDCGSDPLNIVKEAKRYAKEEQQLGDAFDRVYCVFDRDAHASYAAALNAVRDTRQKSSIQAVRSVPCFEYWFLLHYEYTTKPYAEAGGKSVCDQVVADLRKHDPRYTKGCHGSFDALLPHLRQALVHAERSFKSAIANDTENPMTEVHGLVTFLMSIKG